MDRLVELTTDLTTTLRDLREELRRRDLERVSASLAWLDEAAFWLKYELARAGSSEPESVPFTYIPANLRK
jgi:hypothetical protein